MSVLRRKAQAGKQEHQARSMTVPKSLRVGLAKVANDLLEMALVVIGATQETCPGEALAEHIDEADLLVLLDGPSGDMGGAILGPSFVSALIQQQTIGRVTTSSDEGRTLTVTDAALCAPLLDALFSKANSLLETDEDRRMFQPFKFGARSDNKRLFTLALGEPEYHLIKLTIDVAAGTLQSTLTFVLPVRQFQDDTLYPVSPEEGVTATPNTLRSSVMGLRAELTATLCDVKIPLSRLSVLAPGDVLDVPPEAFDEVHLLSVEGRRIASGTLGQVEGQRALMILDPMSRGDEGTIPADAGDFSVSEDLASTTLDLAAINPGAPEILTPEDIPLPEALDVPDADGFPDIGGEGSGVEDALPELPDLPDLDLDLPDLDELPKLNIA